MAEWTLDAEQNHVIEDAETGARLRVRAERPGLKGYRVETFYTASWKPKGEWMEASRFHETVELAKADAEDMLHDKRQKKELAREERSFPEGTGRSTPWGRAQSCTTYGRGVQCYGTAGHGGFLLSKGMNDQVHEAWRSKNGAYEEDGDWAVVAHTFPALFTDREIRSADRTLRDWRPDEYMAVTGKTVTEAESHVLRDRAFKTRHANDYVVVAAVSCDDRPGMVKVWATIGGDRSKDSKLFLVPTAEYQSVPLTYFVVDPARHEAYEEPAPAPRM